MSIVKCKECGKDVSTEAAACPNCGAVPSKKTSGIVKYGGGFIVGIVALTALASMFVTPKQQGSTASAASQPAATPAPAPQPPMEITAGKLFNDYKANEVAADLAYKGKRLAVKGTIRSIDKDFMDDPVVLLATPNQFASVRANFGKSAVSQLAQLQKGTSVTLTCFGAGMVMGSPILDCKP